MCIRDSPGIVHRIDKDTTGALLICKEDSVHRDLAEQLKEHSIKRRYRAIVAGNLKDDEGTVEGPIGRHPTCLLYTSCTSVRLDALIAIAFQASRSSMVSYIEGGQVFVNGKLITSNGYEPKEGDIISVRGKGRFIFEKISGKTKKGRTGVSLLKYV